MKYNCRDCGASQGKGFNACQNCGSLFLIPDNFVLKKVRQEKETFLVGFWLVFYLDCLGL